MLMTVFASALVSAITKRPCFYLHKRELLDRASTTDKAERTPRKKREKCFYTKDV